MNLDGVPTDTAIDQAADPAARVLVGPLTGSNYPYVLYRDPAYGYRIGAASWATARRIGASTL